MTRFTIRHQYSNTRIGSIALMLVLILALLVGTFAASLATLSVTERHNAIDHASVATLQSAIDAVAESGTPDDSSVRLPIDEETGQWVLVQPVTTPEQQWQATLYRSDLPLLSIRRPRRSSP